MAGKFEGKVVIVTGAGRNIGREVALLFAREGAKVVVNDLGTTSFCGGGSDPSIAQAVVEEIKAQGGEAVSETSGISTWEGGKAVVQSAMDAFGRIDYLINNAGIARPNRITEMTEEDFDMVFAVNLKGYFSTVHHAAPYLIRQGGAIVNFSAAAGWGYFGMSNYAAAKEGVVGFTKCIARDLGEFNVRCNAIRPYAYQATDRNAPEVWELMKYSYKKLKVPSVGNQHLPQTSKDALPCHVAAAVAWLCTEESSALNGCDLFISGGQISLVQEPELIRSQFKEGGWDLDSLCKSAVTQALTHGQRNRYTGKG